MTENDHTDWKELHKIAQLKGFGLLGSLALKTLEKFGDDGEKMLREFYYWVGESSANAFLDETKPSSDKSDFQNYLDWQFWFMSSNRADNSGSTVLPLEEVAPGHIRAKRNGCMINNAFQGMGITDVETRKKLCNIFTEIDYGVRDVIAKDSLEFVRFDCQGARENGEPGLPTGKDYCIFEVKITE